MAAVHPGPPDPARPDRGRRRRRLAGKIEEHLAAVAAGAPAVPGAPAGHRHVPAGHPGGVRRGGGRRSASASCWPPTSGPGRCDRELRYPYHPHVTVAHDVPTAALDAVFDGLAGVRGAVPGGRRSRSTSTARTGTGTPQRRFRSRSDRPGRDPAARERSIVTGGLSAQVRPVIECRSRSGGAAVVFDHRLGWSTMRYQRACSTGPRLAARSRTTGSSPRSRWPSWPTRSSAGCSATASGVIEHGQRVPRRHLPVGGRHRQQVGRSEVTVDRCGRAAPHRGRLGGGAALVAARRLAARPAPRATGSSDGWSTSACWSGSGCCWRCRWR